jgi:hypothetical protein
MKAVVYKEPYRVAVEDVDDAKIEDPTDVVIKVTSTAICGSDLHMYEGRTGADPGIVFGHESMGVVEAVGDGVTRLAVGDRVSLPFNVACGFCKNCEQGTTGFCLTVNEGFAGGAYGYAQEIGFFEKGQSIGTGQANVKAYNRELRDLIIAGRAEPSRASSSPRPCRSRMHPTPTSTSTSARRATAKWCCSLMRRDDPASSSPWSPRSVT